LNKIIESIFFTIDVISFDCEGGLTSSLGGDILSVAAAVGISLDD